MLAHLAEVSIRSLLLAVPAVIGLWILRRRRTAALQHAVWSALVCGMLALFAFGQSLPRLPLRILDRSAAAVSATPSGVAIDRAIADGTSPAETPASAPEKPRRPIDWTAVVVYAYDIVAFAFLTRFVTGMFLVRKLLATAHSTVCAERDRVYESERITVPLTVGWLRPSILLPNAWREWDREKLDAVLAHEGAHARRRDGLVAALAEVNRCVFWFHPLAWILERKLALLAEQACDESCVAALGNRERYAHLLLEMALVVDGSQGRLRRHALTMAAGSHIRQRIDSLLQEGRTFSRGLTWTGWAAVTVCGVPLVWGAGALELDRRPPVLSLEMRGRVTPPPPVLEQKVPDQRPVLLAQTRTAPDEAPAPEPVAAVPPKFDVVSVKPCGPGDGAGRSGRGGAGGRGFGSSPGRLWVNCLSIGELMGIAYAEFGNDPLLNDSTLPNAAERLRGGPPWAYSDYYTINAETNDPVANGPTEGRSPARMTMTGPMLQALLEDRFQLKSHREIEEVPMYALTVANGGLKLKPMEEGGCASEEGGFTPPPRGKPPCRWIGWGINGPNRTLEGGGVPLSRLSAALGDLFMDRHVLDKTGITAIFNIHLEYAPDENTPAKIPGGLPVDLSSAIPRAGSIFTALEQQLGLKLVAEKGPHGFIVIDHVERPSGN